MDEDSTKSTIKVCKVFSCSSNDVKIILYFSVKYGIVSIPLICLFYSYKSRLFLIILQKDINLINNLHEHIKSVIYYNRKYCQRLELKSYGYIYSDSIAKSKKNWSLLVRLSYT